MAEQGTPEAVRVTVTRYRASDGTLHDTPEQALSWNDWAARQKLEFAVRDRLIEMISDSPVWRNLSEQLQDEFADDLVKMLIDRRIEISEAMKLIDAYVKVYVAR